MLRKKEINIAQFSFELFTRSNGVIHDFRASRSLLPWRVFLSNLLLL